MVTLSKVRKDKLISLGILLYIYIVLLFILNNIHDPSVGP